MIDPDYDPGYDAYSLLELERRNKTRMFRRVKCVRCGHVEVKSKLKPAGNCFLCGDFMIEVEDD